jgi:transcriptional regulator with XRE-family HTH domain
MKTIGEIIRSQRQKLNITMNDLADKIGTSQSALSYIENDKRLPNHETLKKICKALNMDESDFKELINIRNRLAHGGSITSKYFPSTPDNSQTLKVRDTNEYRERLFRPNFAIELYPGYRTSIQIKTRALKYGEYKLTPETGNTINNFIDKAIKDLIEKEYNWLIKNIEGQFQDYIRELETIMALTKGNNGLEFSIFTDDEGLEED